MPTPYDILGVPSTATYEQIKRAYRRAVKRTHPDAGGSKRAFEAVQQAWETIQLSNGTDLIAPAPTNTDSPAAPTHLRVDLGFTTDFYGTGRIYTKEQVLISPRTWHARREVGDIQVAITARDIAVALFRRGCSESRVVAILTDEDYPEGFIYAEVLPRAYAELKREDRRYAAALTELNKSKRDWPVPRLEWLPDREFLRLLKRRSRSRTARAAAVSARLEASVEAANRAHPAGSS